ncbi:MAG: efflux RND transporter permease subunit [Desulfosalsimonadaceae bacterium]
MNWAGSYLKRPHGITAILLLGVAFGIVSFKGLPLNLFPDTNYPEVAVILVWPGASAEDMADEISRQAERELASIGQTRTVRSTIRDETAAIKVEFTYKKGLDAAVTDVDAALNRIMPELPPDMLPPRLFRVSDATQPVKTLAVSPGPNSSLSMAKVRQLCDNEIKEALLRVPKIADVEVFGGYLPEIRLTVDADRLAELNLTADQVVSAISAQNRNIPTGRLYREKDELLIKIQGERDLRHKLQGIVISQKNGAPVYLGDVADIETTSEERRSFYHGNGRPAIGLNILRAEGGHVTETLTALEEALPEIRSSFPGLRFSVSDTQGEIIETSVSNLITSLRDAVILTVAVIFLLLARMRMTLLAAVSIPFTFLLTFAGMNLLNYELNIVTLTAIILAVGLLVDDAIVVIENIDRHARSGEKTPFQAAAYGTNEIFLADFAGTATTIAVLLPIMFVGGYSQKILRPLTVVLSIALLSSYVVSITVIPLLARWLIKARRINLLESVVEKIRNTWLFPVQKMFTGIFHTGSSKWGFLVFPILIVVLMASLRQMPLAGRDLMPPMDTGIVKISFETWPNTKTAETEAVTEAMEEKIKNTPGFLRMSTAVGSEASVISFGAERTVQEGLITAHFQNRFERPESIWKIEADLRRAFSEIPGIKSVDVYDYGATPLSGIAAPIDVMISGPDPEVLDGLAKKIKKKLRSVRGLTSISRTWDMNKRELAVRLDESRLYHHGISVSDVSRTLEAATSGIAASRFRIPGQDGYTIRYRFDPQNMKSLDRLETLQIPGPNGAVPLKEIAGLDKSWQQTVITREDLQPTVNVLGYRSTTAITHLQDQVNKAVADLKLPAGYSISQEGEIGQMKKSFGRLGSSLALALLLLYFSLTVTFRSFAHPLIIMSAIPFAFIGVPWGMLITGRHFCMPAAMGMVLLSGIVVNNSILLIDFIESERKNEIPVREAVKKAIERRTRPILMTAMSTIAGMIPIAAELAVGLERLSPLAVVAISGLLVSTVLTLGYVPVVYMAVEWVKARLQKS